MTGSSRALFLYLFVLVHNHEEFERKDLVQWFPLDVLELQYIVHQDAEENYDCPGAGFF